MSNTLLGPLAKAFRAFLPQLSFTLWVEKGGINEENIIDKLWIDNVIECPLLVKVATPDALFVFNVSCLARGWMFRLHRVEAFPALAAIDHMPCL